MKRRVSSGVSRSIVDLLQQWCGGGRAVDAGWGGTPHQSGDVTTNCGSGPQVWVLAILLIFSGAVLQACSHPARLASPPQEVALQAVVLDLPNARFWPARRSTQFFEEGMRTVEREMAYLNVTDYGDLPPANFLALSGGSDKGAFGAGLLVGWTEAETRPDFKIVTGISTGALVAPFAFLGSAYDGPLSRMYTTISAENIYTVRGPIAALFEDAANDSTPLFNLIADRVDDEIIAAIASEYTRGRLLLIGTTNLDAREPVIWNIGAIASSGHPGARDLIHKILLASASIPGFFPPVMIDVEVDGEPYQEMHVDGGAIAQLFLYPSAVGDMVVRAGLKRERRAFVIRNSHINHDGAPVKRQAIDIVGRTISTMIFVSGTNDIIRTYLIAQRDGVDFHLAFIDEDFEAPKPDDKFDPIYMKALYKYGYDKARHGFEWHKAPRILGAPRAQ